MTDTKQRRAKAETEAAPLLVEQNRGQHGDVAGAWLVLRRMPTRVHVVAATETEQEAERLVVELRRGKT